MLRVQIIYMIVAILFVCHNTFAAEVLSIKGNKHIENFSEAKKSLRTVFKGYETTLYCGCKYYGKELNLNSCGVYSSSSSARLKRLEWEHVMPAERFGRIISSWSNGSSVCSKREKGRKCAGKASALFRQMEGDLYNLYPESGGINQARSNKPPFESMSEALKDFGKCETRVGKKGFVPRKEARGEITRSYLYMSDAYEIDLSSTERKMFESWNRNDPPDKGECERAKRIYKIQGNKNRFIEASCS